MVSPTLGTIAGLLTVVCLVLALGLVLRGIWVPRGVTDLGWWTLGGPTVALVACIVLCLVAREWLIALFTTPAVATFGRLLSVKGQDHLRARRRAVPLVPPVMEGNADLIRERITEGGLLPTGPSPEALQQARQVIGPPVVYPVNAETEQARAQRMAKLFG